MVRVFSMTIHHHSSIFLYTSLFIIHSSIVIYLIVHFFFDVIRRCCALNWVDLQGASKIRASLAALLFPSFIQHSSTPHPITPVSIRRNMVSPPFKFPPKINYHLNRTAAFICNWQSEEHAASPAQPQPTHPIPSPHSQPPVARTPDFCIDTSPRIHLL